MNLCFTAGESVYTLLVYDSIQLFLDIVFYGQILRKSLLLFAQINESWGIIVKEFKANQAFIILGFDILIKVVTNSAVTFKQLDNIKCVLRHLGHILNFVLGIFNCLHHVVELTF